MSLQRLLEIDGKYITEQQQRAVCFAEAVWTRSGNPTERRALLTVLESVLVHCHAEGLEYPPVFLKRKKQLERGDWRPRPKSLPAPQALGTGSGVPAEWIRQANEQSRRDYDEQFRKAKRHGREGLVNGKG